MAKRRPEQLPEDVHGIDRTSDFTNEGRIRHILMDQPKSSNDMGPIIVGFIMTSVIAILGLLGLGIFIYYITLPPDPYPMDLPEGGLFLTILCPGISTALLLIALFLGHHTLDSFQARRTNATKSIPPAGESRSDSAQTSHRPKP